MPFQKRRIPSSVPMRQKQFRVELYSLRPVRLCMRVLTVLRRWSAQVFARWRDLLDRHRHQHGDQAGKATNAKGHDARECLAWPRAALHQALERIAAQAVSARSCRRSNALAAESHGRVGRLAEDDGRQPLVDAANPLFPDDLTAVSVETVQQDRRAIVVPCISPRNRGCADLASSINFVPRQISAATADFQPHLIVSDGVTAKIASITPAPVPAADVRLSSDSSPALGHGPSRLRTGVSLPSSLRKRILKRS